jgi:hypothetical protein
MRLYIAFKLHYLVSQNLTYAIVGLFIHNRLM